MKSSDGQSPQLQLKMMLVFKFYGVFLFVVILLQVLELTVFYIYYIFFNDVLAKERAHLHSECTYVM